jgi:hypothetical protein
MKTGFDCVQEIKIKRLEAGRRDAGSICSYNEYSETFFIINLCIRFFS